MLHARATRVGASSDTPIERFEVVDFQPELTPALSVPRRRTIEALEASKPSRRSADPLPQRRSQCDVNSPGASVWR